MISLTLILFFFLRKHPCPQNSQWGYFELAQFPRFEVSIYEVAKQMGIKFSFLLDYEESLLGPL